MKQKRLKVQGNGTLMSCSGWGVSGYLTNILLFQSFLIDQQLKDDRKLKSARCIGPYLKVKLHI